jgi:hypothetical protein
MGSGADNEMKNGHESTCQSQQEGAYPHCTCSLLPEVHPMVEGGPLDPRQPTRNIAPIPLNAQQQQAIKEWAADDRLWTTQETVEFNLQTFARVILSLT